MKTTDGTAGYRDEKTREQGVLTHKRLGTQPCRIGIEIALRQIVPKLWDGRHLDNQTYHQSCSHEEKRDGKKRINLAYYLVDRQQGGDDVIDEDGDDPEHLGTTYRLEDNGRTVDEDNAHHHQQQHREDKHHLAGGAAQILAHQFGKTCSAMADTEHSTHIVVHGTGKDTAQYNPKIGHRTIPCTHDGAKDRPGTCYVEKLDHEDFPTGQHDKVYPIRLCHCWRRTVVGSKHVGHKLSIKKITQNEGYQTQ